MGYTARWRVRCISLTEANEILTGCKRLEKENRRQERLQFQERLASMHQFSNLSANAIPFQLQAALPTPRPAGVAGGLLEQGRDGASSDFSPPHRTSGSPLNRLSSPECYFTTKNFSVISYQSISNKIIPSGRLRLQIGCVAWRNIVSSTARH